MPNEERKNTLNVILQSTFHYRREVDTWICFPFTTLNILGVRRAVNFIKSDKISCQISRYATLWHVIKCHTDMYMVPMVVDGICCIPMGFLMRVLCIGIDFNFLFQSVNSCWSQYTVSSKVFNGKKKKK